jgi:hypothetical protein
VNATDKQTGVKPTIVLVHGAFADASSRNGVIGRLQQQGIRSEAQRAGADITEVDGSHVIMISQPQAVTDVIVTAAKAAAGSHR